jgi:hypothetical protein
MNRRLQTFLVYWFVVQIVVPFTAPLQTVDLAGLLGTGHHHNTTASPEASATPTDTGASDSPAAAPLKPTALMPMIADVTLGLTPAQLFDLPLPPVQQAILRV